MITFLVRRKKKNLLGRRFDLSKKKFRLTSWLDRKDNWEGNPPPRFSPPSYPHCSYFIETSPRTDQAPKTRYGLRIIWIIIEIFYFQFPGRRPGEELWFNLKIHLADDILSPAPPFSCLAESFLQIEAKWLFTFLSSYSLVSHSLTHPTPLQSFSLILLFASHSLGSSHCLFVSNSPPAKGQWAARGFISNRLKRKMNWIYKQQVLPEIENKNIYALAES